MSKIALLESKHPAARQIALNEMRMYPEKFRERGIDPDAVLAKYGLKTGYGATGPFGGAE